MRQYQPIWNQLKRDKTVSITVNRRLHPRILKAVVKEKWMDLGYKIDIQPQTAVLSHHASGAKLTFELTLRDAPISEYSLGFIEPVKPAEQESRPKRYARLLLQYFTDPVNSSESI